MDVSVNVDTQLLHEIQSRLGNMSNKAPNVIANALNRAMTTVAASVSQETRKEYTIKATDIKATLSKTKATKSSMQAIVESQGGLVPLDKFQVSPKTVQPLRKKPIKVGVKKNARKEVKGAFVADISGKKVFTRTDKRRLPIKRLMGPSIPQMIGNEEVRNKINAAGFEQFNRRLPHEINRLLDRG
ncbi:hypothetical protein E2329_22820 [Salmonella enterica subsp. enterica]|nr:hypothetical protein [Salmonella enterica subsp. enterica serovar Paratyphi A]